MHPTLTRYLDFVEQLQATPGFNNGYGKCKAVTEAMAETYPELEIRKGVFHDDEWGDRTHWWCRTPEGHIVDPTAKQHPSGEIFPRNDERYNDLTDKTEAEALADGDIPTGKCLDCGKPIFKRPDSQFCTDACADAYHRYMTGGEL